MTIAPTAQSVGLAPGEKEMNSIPSGPTGEAAAEPQPGIQETPQEVFFTSFQLAGLVGGGLGLALTLAVLSIGLRLVTMSREARQVVDRLSPVVGLVVAVGYVGFVVRVLFEKQPELLSVLLGLVLVALVALSWASIRDFVSGVVVKAGQIVRVGDLVQIGEVRGRVVELGYRALVIEGSDGAESVLPFSAVSRGLVKRSQAVRGGHVHVFRLPLAPGAHLPALKRAGREAAMCCHWSSPLLEPRFNTSADGNLEVTVFALHPDYAPDVESAVRAALHRASGA